MRKKIVPLKTYLLSLGKEVVCYSLVFLFAIHYFPKIIIRTNHFTTILFLASFIILPMLIIRTILLISVNWKNSGTKMLSALNNLLLFLFSLIAVAFVFEGALMLANNVLYIRQHPEAYNIPTELNYQTVKIPGTTSAYYWHKKLHVYFAEGFRRTTDFPPKQEGIFRIVVIGDSQTYGFGVDADEAYPAVLEKELRNTYRVEVLNLGIVGTQPADHLKIMQKYLPLLKPDLVVYGVCYNDFMLSGRETYTSDNAYLLPFPEGGKIFLRERVYLSYFFSVKYNTLLFRLGLRHDFMGDIARGLYQADYAKAVKEINDYALSQGLPPIIVFVTDQAPDLKGVNWKVTQITERILLEAGFNVMPMEDYYQKYNRQTFFVSKWEKHPSVQAHQIFAELLTNYLKKLPQLQPFKQD